MEEINELFVGILIVAVIAGIGFLIYTISQYSAQELVLAIVGVVVILMLQNNWRSNS